MLLRFGWCALICLTLFAQSCRVDACGPSRDAEAIRVLGKINAPRKTISARQVSAEDSLDDLFTKAANSKGESYPALRTKLLSQGGKLNESLNRFRESKDWKVRLQARILRGWLDHPKLYAELWKWKAQRGSMRIPFSQAPRDAKRKFQAAGNIAVPVMLELIWKKHEMQYGVLPALLHEKQDRDVFNVFVDWLENGSAESISTRTVPMTLEPYTVPLVLVPYGKKATPHLVKRLANTDGDAASHIVMALGRIGDPSAVPAVQDVLLASESRDAREAAARALGELQQAKVLRASYVKVRSEPTKVAVLEVLRQDGSKETRNLLIGVANNSDRGGLRLQAVRSLMREPKATNIPLVCELVACEPHEETRAYMVLYLGMWDGQDATIRKALLKLLNDEFEGVQHSAIAGLKTHLQPEVTKALLPFLKSEKVLIRRRAIRSLHQRNDPAIGAAAVGLLEDKDRWVWTLAIEALVNNRTPKALKPLIKHLQSATYRSDRCHAAEAIGRIGGKEALAALKTAAKTEQDPSVRASIEIEIKRLTKRKKN